MSADRGGDAVAARDALTALARARRRHRDGLERFTDLYVWGFSGLVLGTWVLSFARETFAGRVCRTGDGCVVQEHPAYAAAAVLLLGLGALLLAAGAVGPLSADRAVARWLLGTTADRAVLLRGALAGAVTGTALGGACVGLLVGLAAAGGEVRAVALGVGAVLGLVVGAWVAVLLVLRQGATEDGRRAPGRAPGVLLVAVGAVLAGAVVVQEGRLPEVVPTGGAVLRTAWVAAGLLAAALVVALVVVRRPGGRLAELGDAQLARGREVVDAVADSTMMLDATAVAGLQRRRSDLRRGRHPSRGLHGRGAVAFLVADLRLVARRWRSVVLSALALPAILVVGEGFGYGGAVLVAALVTAWAGRQAGQGLRTWLGSRGLRRSVAVPTWEVTLALTALPTLAAACVAVPAVLLVGGPWWGGLHLAVGGLAATMRSADPVPTELGAVATTPAGALPTGLVRQVLHGPDLALVLALALVLLGEPRTLLVAVVALAWQVTRER